MQKYTSLVTKNECFLIIGETQKYLFTPTLHKEMNYSEYDANYDS